MGLDGRPFFHQCKPPSNDEEEYEDAEDDNEVAT
jgi:hypothetical protein